MRCVSPHYRSILMLSTKKCPLASGPIYSANETDFRNNSQKIVLNTKFCFPGSTGNFGGLIEKNPDFFSKMDASKKAHTINMSLLCVKCRHGLRPNTLLASNIAKREAQHLRFSQN